ncbi:MAG TPA: dihydrolipoyllysine-residue acetyltransferase [Candidatus Desulfobacillus sp.]|nr:dihydrolipoyllysine-residue acetyltransferase [Candidatus Desulfobacillus sp.]
MALIEVKVPDIGDFGDVPVIEIAVKAGDTVKEEDTLVTLESDKATMDVPSPAAGTVKELRLKVGDKVSEGSVVLVLEGGEQKAGSSEREAGSGGKQSAISSQPSASGEREAASSEQQAGSGEREAAVVAPQPAAPPATPSTPLPAPSGPSDPQPAAAGGKAHASPSVRRFARELGVDVARVDGSGPKGRILREDVQAYVKAALAQPGGTRPAAAGGGLDLLPWPQVDFAKFGPVEARPLSRIKKLSGANLARNWVMIPHVTQFDEADITELEALRVQLNRENEKAGIRLTLLAFLIKASVAALRKFPEFNASLDGENLVLKRYFHIGFAADTPNGLVVPVIRDCDRKGVLEIAQEMAALSAKAREGKLAPAEMQGGCFSISSLGGIGGTAFTPIINAPEVAILGVSKSQTRPQWDGKQFAPRLMLPLSLSYDHRVIDGAQAARFTAWLAQALSDLRRVLL